jgi:hypothetical protein
MEIRFYGLPKAYTKDKIRERKIPNTRKDKIMTVREVMEVMAHWDPDAVVVPCDWGEVVAVRAFRADRHDYQVQWEVPEEDDEEDE